MSTSAKGDAPSITSRKQHHIDVCKLDSEFDVEGTRSAGFESIQFIHHALPELNIDEITTEWTFLGKTLPIPLFISCMTGGSPEGKHANRELALAAQRCRLPLGLGSMRVALEHPERLADFQVRSLAPDIPILGNIGGMQLRHYTPAALMELVKKTEVDALVVHLNCGQEIFQKGGDRDFTGIFQAICQLVEHFKDIPVIVKETGFGLRPKVAYQLLDCGVAYIDVAGAGGTNWVTVEDHCCDASHEVAKEFANWGLPTAVLLKALEPVRGKILASGGIRTGLDLAKSLALGVVGAGMALPLIRSALDGGADRVCAAIDNLSTVLRSVMLMTGSDTITSLQEQPLIVHPSMMSQVDALLNADGIYYE